MSSSLEAAITVSAVILLICMFVLFPVAVFMDSFEASSDFSEEMYRTAYGSNDETLSQERLNTFLTGLSENYRIIYGGVTDAIFGD